VATARPQPTTDGPKRPVEDVIGHLNGGDPIPLGCVSLSPPTRRWGRASGRGAARGSARGRRR